MSGPIEKAGFGSGGRLARCVLGLGVLATSPGWTAEATDNAGAAKSTPADASPRWSYQLYVDAGYAASDNEPENHTWRSKSTTFKLDEPELFLGVGVVRKQATPESRWGFEFGLQAGVNTELLVPEAPPPAEEPLEDADRLRYLYRANVSYLFDAGRGVRLSAGLIDSYVAYESYLAIRNPNYTIGYITDMVPYFLVGLEAQWDVSERVDLGFFLVTGYNYLAKPNDAPSFGFQAVWHLSPRLTVKQNLYYGPDQAETNVEFWRLLSNTIAEWTNDRFLIAASIDFGTEKQARLPTQPRHRWSSAALWVRWKLGNRWSVALRPEFFRDEDGQMTRARQTIQAYTATLKYQFSPRHHRLVGTLEARHDRSTGDEGGFFEGPDNVLVSNQNLVLVGLLWSFDR